MYAALYLCLFTVSYVFGAMPTGYLVARLKGISDIRMYGSGNIGATNVARALGFPFFVLIFLLDAGKAFLNVWLLSYWGLSFSILVAVATVHLIGNGYSFFLGGAGGKGVATTVGLLCALQAYVVPCFLAAWLGALVGFHVIGMASVISIMCLPLFSWWCGYNTILILHALFMSFWVIFRHKKNIQDYVKRYMQ